jgi:hypothetical protein
MEACVETAVDLVGQPGKKRRERADRQNRRPSIFDNQPLIQINHRPQSIIVQN